MIAHHPTEKGFADPQSIERNRAQWAGTSKGYTTCCSYLQQSKYAPSITVQSPSSQARTSVSLPTICRFATYSCPRNLLSCSLLGMKTRSCSIVSRVHGFSYVNFWISHPAGLGSM